MSDTESSANAASDTPDNVSTASDQSESKLCGAPEVEDCSNLKTSECVAPSLNADHVKRLPDQPPNPQLSSPFHIVHKIRLSQGETNDSPNPTLGQTAATQAIATRMHGEGETEGTEGKGETKGTEGKGETEGTEGISGKEGTDEASDQVEPEVGEASGGSNQGKPITQGETCGGPLDGSETITEENNLEGGTPMKSQKSPSSTDSEDDGVVKLKMDGREGTLDYEAKCHRKDSASITQSLASMTRDLVVMTRITKQSSESSLIEQKDVTFFDQANGISTKHTNIEQN